MICAGAKILHPFFIAAILAAMKNALAKEDSLAREKRLFSKNSHQGFSAFFRPLRRGIGLRSLRRHWGKRVFCGRLVSDALYHGIWGSGDDESKNYTWKTFAPLLNQKDHYTIKAVDYTKENAYSFDDLRIRKKLTDSITIILGKIRARKLAAKKVDIVVHSMGGLVVRSFCAKYPDACKRSIHKLITIDTPHYGSALADWLLLHEMDPVVFYRKLQIVDYSEEERKEQRDDCDAKVDSFITGGSAFQTLGSYSPSVEPHYSGPRKLDSKKPST